MELIYIIAYFVIGFIISSIITRCYNDFGVVEFIIVLFGWPLAIPAAICGIGLFYLIEQLEKFMDFIRGRN